MNDDKIISLNKHYYLYGFAVYELLMIIILSLLSILEIIFIWNFTFSTLLLISLVLCYRFYGKNVNVLMVGIILFKYYVWDAQHYD